MKTKNDAEKELKEIAEKTLQHNLLLLNAHIKNGYSLECWQNVLSVMIEKVG